MLSYNYIDPSWNDIFTNKQAQIYLSKISEILEGEYKKNKIIFPEPFNIFSAFTHTKYNEIKVVILGQDPYHKKGQAHGLSFSVPKSEKIPPSLKNIFKEIYQDSNSTSQQSGDLTYLAIQGVLLLNNSLTVEEGKPASHKHIPWEQFTNYIIEEICKTQKNIVFLLWGAFAQKKEIIIKKYKNINNLHILKTSHPSPLSAYRGFLGSNCFNDANTLLTNNNIAPITWKSE